MTYVFKMQELIVIVELLSILDDPTDSASDSYSDTASDSADADSDSDSDSISAPESDDKLSGPSNTSDVLDLILTRSTGSLVLWNIFALTLNGKIDMRGRPATNVSKAGWDKDDIPAFTAEEEEDTPSLDLDSEDDDQRQEDTKASIKGYVRKWWDTSKNTRNPAHKVAVKIMRRKAADNLVNDHFESLLKTLFYGDRSLIKDCGYVRQTSYGKCTTAMEDLASKTPEAFGTTALDRYLEENFTFIDHFKECKERGRSSATAPPPLPHDKDHHSRNNRVQPGYGVPQITTCSSQL
ncbi:hypothetical protein BGX28_009400 [Mortierella sp. GBA30]|nr:hypothetical protein BGX28_009400 [Mortierella sp. GBA30]